MSYQVADTWNNEAGLANLIPQPATPDRLQIEANYAADASSTGVGMPYVDLVYTVLTNSEFSALNTQLGISLLSRSNAVTIAVKQDDDSYANYNAMVYYPDAKHSPVGWKATYRVVLVEAL